MKRGLWVSDTEFREFSERDELSRPFAVRTRSRDWFGFNALLPDPDPILRKTGKDMQAYRALLQDSHVWSCYESRKSGALSCEWEIREAATGSPRTNRKISDEIEDHFLNVLDMEQFISDALDAPFYGISPLEIQWDSVNGRWLPVEISGRPPEWFAFDQANNLRFLSRESYTDGELPPDKKFLLCRYHATYNNPYGERLLARAFWPVAFKKGGLRFWAVFTEKYGMPWAIGKTPRGAHETHKTELLGKLAAMVQDAVAVIENDELIEIIESAGKSASADIYEKLIRLSDEQISKSFLGQTLTTEVGNSGSRALGDVHLQVRGDLIESDKRRIRAEINKLLRWICEFNWAGAATPTFEWIEDEDLQTERAERDGKLKSQGLNFSRTYYMRTYNLEETDLVEEEKPEKKTIVQPDPDDEPASDFSSGEFNEALKSAISSQKYVDRLVDETVQGAGPEFDKFLKIISGFLQGASSLKQARDGVHRLYDQIDGSALAELLQDALYRSDMIGVDSIGEPADFSQAFWGDGQTFEEAIDYFKAKAFTIAGVSKADLLADVKDSIIKAMDTGQTLDEFRENFLRIASRHGWSGVTDWRIRTIFETNIQAAYQAGRFRQMTKPEILETRPYWRYVAVMDPSTRPNHAAMHGKIYRADHKIWLTWYPPNGFNCRCTVISVSLAEIERNGWTVATDDITGKLIEPIDPATQMRRPAVLMMPDRGWGSRADLAGLFDEKIKSGEKGRVTWRETPGQPGPAELSRPKKGEIQPEFWRPSPGKMEILERIMARQNISREAALLQIEKKYRQVMGISPKDVKGVLRGPDGEILDVSLDSLAHAMLKREEARERFIPYFRDVIEHPFEILLTEYSTESGKTKFRKKFIGLYIDDKAEGIIITAEINNENYVIWNVMNTKKQNLDRQRRAMKVLYAADWDQAR